MPRGVPVMTESAALLFADNSTDTVNCDSNPSLDNIAVGTAVWWGYWPSVANVARAQWGMAGGTNGRICFRRGGDGTTLRFQYGRSTSAFLIDSSTGMLAANIWMCVAVTWDVAAGLASWYRGTQVAPAVAYGASPTVGSGTHDDSAGSFSLGLYSGTNSDAVKYAAKALFNRVLSLPGIIAWQFSALDEPLPAVMAGCVGLWYPGNDGSNKVIDYSGYHNDGTITGATVSRGVSLPARDAVRDRLRARS